MRTIAVTSARSSTFSGAAAPADDVYVVEWPRSPNWAVCRLRKRGLLLNTLPGVSPIAARRAATSAAARQSAGSRQHTGYQLEGLNATDPLTGYFMNNLVLNGAQSVNLTDGPGDASKGGSAPAS